MPPPDKSPPPAGEDGSSWLFTWEAQSHTSTLRLLLFKPNTNPSAHCRDLKLSLPAQKYLLTVSFSEGEGQSEASFTVPVPRVLIDSETTPHLRVFDDHIEVKFVLLLPVDHPLVSDFDSVLDNGGNGDMLRPISVDSDLKKLSCMKEVHLYCRNCSSKLTECLRCFKEMPSVNWRDVADNWFGNCCCSFGGVSEKLVAEYTKSYTCVSGLCLLSPTSVLLSVHDILGFEFPDVQPRQNAGPNLHQPVDSSSSSDSLNEDCEKEQPGCCENHSEVLYSDDKHAKNEEYESSKELLDDDSLSCTISGLHINENKGSLSEKIRDFHNGCCTASMLETFSKLQKSEGNVELLENQKMYRDGYLGNGFMVRSSELSKDIRWNSFLCPQCACPVGAYPCFGDDVPLDGGIRLFKCCVSTSLPSSGSDDAFGNYTLERMFASQLLESAEDELSFKTIVRDVQTKSPALQIVLLNPNSWSCGGSLDPAEQAAKLVMYPNIKLLFSHGVEFDSRILDEWVRKNEADEIYMFSSQIVELIRVLELASSLYPPSCRSMQGLLLSSMKR